MYTLARVGNAQPAVYHYFGCAMYRTCTQIIWTEECERSLEEYENGAEDAVKKYLEVCCVRLEGLIKLVQGE